MHSTVVSDGVCDLILTQGYHHRRRPEMLFGQRYEIIFHVSMGFTGLKNRGFRNESYAEKGKC